MCFKEARIQIHTVCTHHMQTIISKDGKGTNLTLLIWGDSWPFILISKALTRESLICLCTRVHINVTKPCQTLLLIGLRVIKSTLLKCILLQHISTVLSFIHLPVCHPPVLHLLSISPPVRRSPSPSPHSTHPSFPTLSHSLSLSPPTLPSLSFYPHHWISINNLWPT